MVDPTVQDVRPYTAFLAVLLNALPAGARNAYGAELAAVYEEILQEAFAEAGVAGVCRRMPGLIADAVAAIVLEYIDVWRGSSFPPLRIAVWSLAGAAFVWSLTLVAAFSEAGWVVKLLEFNLAMTVTFMLGLPALSLVASRVGAGPGRPPTGRSMIRTGVTATAVTWSVFLCHVAG